MSTKEFKKGIYRILKESNKKRIENEAKSIAQKVIEGGGFAILLLPISVRKDEKTERAIKNCLLYKYGIEEMEPWLDEEHKSLRIYTMSSFDDSRKEKIRKKIERDVIPFYKKALEEEIEKAIKKLSQRNTGAIFAEQLFDKIKYLS